MNPSNNHPDVSSSNAGTYVPRRTFLKRAGQVALAFTIVDLATTTAEAVLSGTCDGKKYGKDGDDKCNNGMNNPNLYNRDETCNAGQDKDQACGAPVPADKIQEHPSGGGPIYYDRDQSCDPTVHAPGSDKFDESHSRGTPNLVN